MKQTYEKHIKVCQYECDFNDIMKVSSIMRNAEQISEEQCDELGLTKDFYNKTHTAFLLAKVSIDLYKPMKPGDNIKIITKPFMPVRAVYTRHTEFYNEQGEKTAFVDAKWVLVDTKTRRIMRRFPEEFNFPFEAHLEQENNIKIDKIDFGERKSTVEITYSKMDINGHMNNANYADVVCDNIPLDEFKNGNLKNMTISYHNEIMGGEKMDIVVASQQTPKRYYVLADNNGKCIFEAEVKF